MARWLVALAVVLVSRPIDAGFRVEQWQRRVTATSSIVAPSRNEPTLAAVTLDHHLRAIERTGALDIVDRHTGQLVATTPLAMGGIQAVSRAPRGDLLLVKTRGDLVAIESPGFAGTRSNAKRCGGAIDRSSGQIRWRRPTSSIGNAVASSKSIVDAWVDRAQHRYGLVARDPRDGRVIETIDLGGTGGWYDVEKIELSPDSPDDVLVSAVFGKGRYS